MPLTRFFVKERKPSAKRPTSSRERRLSLLLVYSHGKTHTLSFSLGTLLSIMAAVCVSLAALGIFVNSYMETAKQNEELNYLHDVAGTQEKQIQELQQHILEMAQRLRQTELAESETRSMLIEEGLLQEGTSELAAVVAARQVMAATTSRSGRHAGRIPVRDMASVLDSLERLALELDCEIGSLQDCLNDLREEADKAVAYARAQPNIWPVHGSLTSPYGWRRHPITGRQQFHEGIDIGAQYRAPIRAAADGTVKFAGYKSGYGRTIIISHGYGLETLYSHCSSMAVTAGQKVRRSDTIGYVGTSGIATGPHLHYEVCKHGKKQDPLDYLPD